MLDYEGEDFEDVFMQSFQISYDDVFGSTITHELKENGDSIPVTQANKHVCNRLSRNITSIVRLTNMYVTVYHEILHLQSG